MGRVLTRVLNYWVLGPCFKMADNLASLEIVNAITVLDRILEAAQALLVSIQKLEDDAGASS